jgi:hypothetical protein
VSLPRNDRGYHTQTQTGVRGFMKYAVGMGTGAMMYIPCFKKIGLGIQKLIRGRHRQQSDPISLLLFFFKIRTVS